MTKIYSFILFISLSLCLNAQITLQTNMPKSIAPNANIVVEIKINKGGITNFAKYQMDVPTGVTVTEGDSKTGNFTFEGNRAKIVWVSIPTDPEFVVTFKLNAGSASGANVFNHKFYYLDNGVKKEVEGEAINVTFDGGGATDAATLPTETKTEPVKETKTENTATPTETKVATTETKTETTSTPTETKVATTETKTEPVKETKTETTSTPTETKVATTETKTESVKETQTEPIKVTKTEPVVTVTKNENAKTSTSGTVYKIQLGAYGSDPGQGKFAAIGKVTMSNEGGFVKALFGNFSTKEEALKKREELISKGFTGFVVAYQNGVRVK
ncbi:MAG: SPOR domain-containing protein [Bacteroidota bacterium]|nr:SPOR domain-containing protein [Bacteroidota bacterium]